MRWAMIALAFLATVINYLDRQTLSVAAPILRRELGFGDIEYSRIVSAFMLAYTVMNGLSGPLIDRIGTRWGYGLCMLWWSTASLLHSFARSAFSLGVFRFLLGMGEAGNWPAALKLVNEWFPVRERALASGIFNSGSAIGALAAPPLVAWLILHFGWKSAFAAVSLAGYAWLAIFMATYRTPPEVVAEVQAAPPQALKLFSQRFVWSLTLAKLFFDPAWYFYIFWFPQYLSSARHFDMAQIGLYSWIPFLTADMGNIAGGLLASFLIRRGVALMTTRKICFFLFAGCMTSAIPAVLVESAYVSIALVACATFGYTACSANMMALPGDVYPKNAQASIWGLASMGSGFGGMMWSLVTGLLVASFSYVPVFFLFGLMPLVCATILFAVTCRSKNTLRQASPTGSGR